MPSLCSDGEHFDNDQVYVHKKHSIRLRRETKYCCVTCGKYDLTLNEYANHLDCNSNGSHAVALSPKRSKAVTYSDTKDDRVLRKRRNLVKKEASNIFYCNMCNKDNIPIADLSQHFNCLLNKSTDRNEKLECMEAKMLTTAKTDKISSSSEVDDSDGGESYTVDNVQLPSASTGAFERDKVTHPTISYGSKKNLKLMHINSYSENPDGSNVVYSCSVCGQEQMSIKEMFKHLQCKPPLPAKKVPAQPVSCTHCGKMYKNKIMLKTHVMMHMGVQPYQCSIELCDKGFIFKSSLKKHLLVEHNQVLKEYKCQVCNKLFSTESNRKKHEINHEEANKNKEKPMFLCSSCGKYFTTPSNLKTHELSVHATQPKKHICDICGMGFHLNNALKIHIKRHAGIKNFVCETCGAAFIREHELQMHQACHSDYRPFVCKMCDKSFKRLRNLKSHEAWVHEILPVGVETYSCDMCGKELATKKKLASHAAAHSQNRQYPCDKCENVYNLKKVLDQHKRQLHSKICYKKEQIGDRSFACNECDKVFKGRPNLSQHLRKVHHKEKYSSRKFPCSHCGKVFNFKNSLDEHVRIHLGLKPYTCQTCNKSFRTWGDLHRHKQTHTDLKPFSCESCSKRFRRRCHLHVHMRVHTGLKPYSCEICGRAFAYNNERIKHRAKAHRLEASLL